MVAAADEKLAKDRVEVIDKATKPLLLLLLSTTKGEEMVMVAGEPAMNATNPFLVVHTSYPM